MNRRNDVMALIALVTAGALLSGCGGVDADGGDFAVDTEEAGAALTESTCNDPNLAVDAFIVARNFPAPGGSLMVTSGTTYGRPGCTRAHILDVFEPAGTNNVVFITNYIGVMPRAKAACEALRLRTRVGDSDSPLTAVRETRGIWNGTSCRVPNIADALRPFTDRARLVTQATDASGALVGIRTQVGNPL